MEPYTNVPCSEYERFSRLPLVLARDGGYLGPTATVDLSDWSYDHSHGKDFLAFGDDDPRNISLRVPNDIGKSNNTGELIAVKAALEACPVNAPLRILSDSKLAVDGLTKNLRKWEDGGYGDGKRGPPLSG